MQCAKMAVLACELSSPAFVSLPRSFIYGAPGVDKRDTSMLALHWVSATELHQACNQRGGRVVIWGPPPPQPSEQRAPPPPSQQRMNGTGGREDFPPGMSKKQKRSLMHRRDAERGGGGAGGRRGERERGGDGLSLPLQLPLSSPQQQQHVFPLPPPIVPTPVEPYPLLRSLVSDQAFQLFFAQLAAAGSNNQRFVPVLN